MTNHFIYPSGYMGNQFQKLGRTPTGATPRGGCGGPAAVSLPVNGGGPEPREGGPRAVGPGGDHLCGYRSRMQRIGIIGGMSWESTTEYCRLLNLGVRERLGGLHSARLLLATVDFAPIVQLQQAGDWDAAGEALAVEARALEAGGADLVLIAANTMHLVIDQVAAAVSIPVRHIGDVMAAAVKAAGLTRVGLLATKYTMELDFYRDRLASHGVEALIPDAADRTELQRIIFDELCHGLVTDTSRERLLETARNLLDSGAEGIVLGCTELELSIRAEHLAAPLFPTTALHCEAALDRAFT